MTALAVRKKLSFVVYLVMKFLLGLADLSGMQIKDAPRIGQFQFVPVSD